MKEYKLPEVVKKLLKDKRMTQQELADKIGQTQRSISMWLNDEAKPNVYSLMNMAWALGVTIDYLIYGE